MNEPRVWNPSDGGLGFTTLPKTDFWRVTHDGGVRDNGHFYYETVEGDCTATVYVEGDFSGLYDQAGLMLRIDEKNWLKCGLEFFEEQCHRSVVVTRDFSDWSIVSQGERNGLWLRLERKEVTVEIAVSEDGKRFNPFRQCYFPPVESVMLGLMAASPLGEGFAARFEHFEIR